mgnify:CR=1 FL=1
MSDNLTSGVMAQAGDGRQEGARVVTRVKPVFWERTGRLNLQAAEIHLQGVGSLLAQIEALRQRLVDLFRVAGATPEVKKARTLLSMLLM